MNLNITLFNVRASVPSTKRRNEKLCYKTYLLRLYIITYTHKITAEMKQKCYTRKVHLIVLRSANRIGNGRVTLLPGVIAIVSGVQIEHPKSFSPFMSSLNKILLDMSETKQNKFEIDYYDLKENNKEQRTNTQQRVLQNAISNWTLSLMCCSVTVAYGVCQSPQKNSVVNVCKFR
jgi:hypothetical protein